MSLVGCTSTSTQDKPRLIAACTLTRVFSGYVPATPRWPTMIEGIMLP
ncbi:Uncharacterised protein [Vibrio cholerae]|nr:Uncharacterised protein [Vibrio cholerae]